MGYTDTARILAQSHGIDDYPVVSEERGEELYEEAIRTPADYAKRASLVLVNVGREVRHMSRPELERALFADNLVSCEAFPDPGASSHHYVRLVEGGPRHSDVGYLKIPSSLPLGVELGNVLESVTDPDVPEDTPDSVWGVSHFDPGLLAPDYFDAAEHLHLYGEDQEEPDADRVSDAVDELYASSNPARRDA